ncbi:unnamed protein product [Ambrosiozyma monospora]|uniref:Unnamed protein product n=1 Tax=Ambrosiozyma monospora TaxID=43982 RepID=A0ACB5SSX9_AMBMO|nr:unnamed protein product [Ambrosiozyma monospora]
MKSVAYGTPGAKNRVIQNWKIPMNAITDPKFVYLEFPLLRSKHLYGLGFGLLDLSHQMMGRKAFYIYLTLTRSDFHSNMPAPITTFSTTSLPPDAELISHVQHKHTGSPIQPTSFNSTSKTSYESNWKDYIITPFGTRDNNITNWKQFWSKFSIFVNKNPGSYSTFHRFQTGNLYHQLTQYESEENLLLL